MLSKSRMQSYICTMLLITVEMSSPVSNPKPAPGQRQRLLCSTSARLSKRDEPELRELERSEIAMTRTNGKTDKKMYSHPEIFSSHGQCCGQQGCVEIPLGPGTAVSCCLLSFVPEAVMARNLSLSCWNENIMMYKLLFL